MMCSIALLVTTCACLLSTALAQVGLPPVHEGANQEDGPPQGAPWGQGPPPPGLSGAGPPPPGFGGGPPPPGFGPPPPFPDTGVPPGFETVLPPDVVEQLKALHDNQALTFPQKREEFDRILNSVPGSVLSQLPFPPGFNALPSQVRDQIQAIHSNPQLSWNEKSKQIGEIIEQLPPNLRQFLPGAPPGMVPGARRPNFPPTPPPGFERVLPRDVYDRLLVIHQDASKTPKEKIHDIDTIMRSLPQATLDALPLPPGFDQLPAEVVKQARAIFADKSLDYESKNKKIIHFVKSLPPAQKQLVKPPMPLVLSVLPPEVRTQIDSIFEDETLTEDERQSKFWRLVNSMSPEDQARIHFELGDGEEEGAPPSPPGGFPPPPPPGLSGGGPPPAPPVAQAPAESGSAESTSSTTSSSTTSSSSTISSSTTPPTSTGKQ